MFVVSTTVRNGFDNIAVPKSIAEIWEHDDIAKKRKSYGAKKQAAIKQTSHRQANSLDTGSLYIVKDVWKSLINNFPVHLCFC